ncbi:hypothetical protein FQN55_003023 [Onygenales sp. PD_40]|nr:hypothetical protein FQN55_003023 [Onygenales sp. PD_40]KAK2784730.1 hypothetical protein FQN53_008286 [Emmonsiellopsis sp. PD_33]
MRRLSLYGARWHRHGVHKSRPSYGAPTYPPPRRLLSSTAALSNDRNDSKPPVVRWFEQDTRFSKHKVEVDPEKEEQEEQEEIWAKIRELQAELKEIRKGPFAPNSLFMKQLPEDQKKIVLDAVRKYEEENAEEVREMEQEEENIFAELDEMVAEEQADLESQKTAEWNPKKMLEEVTPPPPPPKPSFEVEYKVPDTVRGHLNRFNQNLAALHQNPTRAIRQELWRSYKRCKASIPGFIEIMPEETVDMLWNSQSQSASPQTPQLGHWEEVAEDILSSGRDFTQAQWMEYITLLLESERTNKALTLWKSREKHLNYSSTEYVNKFWKLGVEILIANGELENAQDIATAFLADDKSRESRILIPIILAWAKTPGDENGTRAWTLYLRLKTMLGPDITMNDYDSLSVGFLKAGRVDMAVAVFKDMMLTGQSSPSDSTSLYNASLGLVGNLQESSITEADVNKVSLSALTIMPRRFQNKFFYASWMKKLIGMGEVDSAAQVVELMYERGIKPDPKHLNGIIGGWLRKESSTARDKAERLAWAMVQERIDQVWARRKDASATASQKPLVQNASHGLRIPTPIDRTVPPASIETFSILLLYYTRRGQDDMANYVIECLEKSKMRPNTFFMNHLLFAELRKQDMLSVWTRYKEMSTTILPDLETFACLWDCGKVQYDRARKPFDASFPTARALFAEMMTWYHNLKPFQQANVRTFFSKELYDQILRCFSFSLDAEGTIVALHSLRHAFGFIPDVVTARIIMFEVVRLLPPPPSPTQQKKSRRRRGAISLNPRSKENLQHVSTLLETLRDRKLMILGRQGFSLEDLDVEARKDHEVGLYVDLLRVVLGRLAVVPERVGDRLDRAVREMGVAEEGLYLGEEVPEDLEA